MDTRAYKNIFIATYLIQFLFLQFPKYVLCLQSGYFCSLYISSYKNVLTSFFKDVINAIIDVIDSTYSDLILYTFGGWYCRYWCSILWSSRVEWYPTVRIIDRFHLQILLLVNLNSNELPTVVVVKPNKWNIVLFCLWDSGLTPILCNFKIMVLQIQFLLLCIETKSEICYLNKQCKLFIIYYANTYFVVG